MLFSSFTDYGLHMWVCTLRVVKPKTSKPATLEFGHVSIFWRLFLKIIGIFPFANTEISEIVKQINCLIKTALLFNNMSW